MVGRAWNARAIAPGRLIRILPERHHIDCVVRRVEKPALGCPIYELQWNLRGIALAHLVAQVDRARFHARVEIERKVFNGQVGL